MNPKALRAARKRLGLTQRALAEQLRLSTVSVRNMEGGFLRITDRTAFQVGELLQRHLLAEAQAWPPLPATADAKQLEADVVMVQEHRQASELAQRALGLWPPKPYTKGALKHLRRRATTLRQSIAGMIARDHNDPIITSLAVLAQDLDARAQESGRRTLPQLRELAVDHEGLFAVFAAWAEWRQRKGDL